MDLLVVSGTRPGSNCRRARKGDHGRGPEDGRYRRPPLVNPLLPRGDHLRNVAAERAGSSESSTDGLAVPVAKETPALVAQRAPDAEWQAKNLTAVRVHLDEAGLRMKTGLGEEFERSLA